MNRVNLTSHDGKVISVVEWAEAENPTCVVQISHGMAEHALRYEYFARKMNERGYIVVADDHRAHGITDKDTHGYCDGDIFNDTLQDMKVITEHYKAKYGLPVVLFGHSYGSFLTQRYVQEYADGIAGAVIGGSSHMGVALAPVGVMLSTLLCWLGLSKKPANLIKKLTFDVYDRQFEQGSFISSQVDECERYNADPNCGFVCSYNFYKCFFNGLSAAYRKNNLAGLKADFPLLLISGASDPVGEKGKGVDRLEAMYGEYGLNVKKVLYDGVRHEYLNDTSREAAIDEIAAFVNKVTQ